MRVFLPEFKNIYQSIFYNNVLNEYECLAVEQLAPNLDRGTLSNDDVNNQIRRSEVGWISPNKESKWLFDRLEQYINHANENLYKFKLTGMCEPLQVAVYEGNEEGYYDWHIDPLQNSSKKFGTCRKLSCSLQLTNPKKYEGGNLKIKTDFINENQAEKSQGSLTIFPSFMPHRVEPVTKGVRKSLVIWVHGPQFE